MSVIKRYKLYKQKKQWVIGCSAVLLSLTMGMTVAHADQTNSATPAMPTTSGAQKDLTTSQENKQVVTLSSTDDAANRTSATQTSQEAANSQPVLNDNQPVANNKTTPDKEYNRVIHIQASGFAYNGQTVKETEQTITQQSVNGHWDSFDWTLPTGYVPDGVAVPSIHLDAADNVSGNQDLYFRYIARVTIYSLPDGDRPIMNVYLVQNGHLLTIPDQELVLPSGVPTGYRPSLPFGINDQIIERDGHYYLTGATITNETKRGTMVVTYHGSKGSTEDYNSNANKIYMSAPVNLVFKDMNGNLYNAYSDKRPSGNAVTALTPLNYGQTYDKNVIYNFARQQLSQYLQNAGVSADNYQIYGYFGNDGKLHQIKSSDDYPSLDDTVGNEEGLNYEFVVINKQSGTLHQTPLTKTRTINVMQPDGNVVTTKQAVQFQQFGDYDAITGQPLNDAPWKVLTGNNSADESSWSELTDNNHQWASFTAPTYAGYKPSQAVVDAQTVTPNSSDTVINIGYSQIDVPVVVPDKPVLNVIRYVDQEGNVVKTDHQEGKENDPIKLSLPDGYHYVGSQPVLTISADHSLQIVHVAKDTVPTPQTPDQPTKPDHQSESAYEQTGSTSAKPVVQHQAVTKGVAASANKHATQLPQTGNQNSVLALLGLASASLAICLGLGKKRD